MSTSADKPAEARRHHDARASRDALLTAAEALFDERGYEAATVREIGESAGVDPALIARYFGSKVGLYLAALQRTRAPLPSDPVEALRGLLSRTEDRGSGPIARAMVSATLSDELRAQVREITRGRLVAPLAAELAARGVRDPELRIELMAAIATGTALTRASGTLPTLAAASLDEVLAVLEPLVELLGSP